MKPHDYTRLTQIIIIIISFFNLAFGPAIVGKVKEGNKLYEKENYDEALKKYTDAQIDRPESPELFYNIANILYKQRKYNEAETMFNKAIPQSDTPLEAKIYYNIGDCKYKQGQLRESLDYYKKALELSPEDNEAKYNIEFVEKKIKEMMSQAKERQEKQEKQEKKEGEKKEQGKGGQQGQEEKTGRETQAAKEKQKEQKEGQAAPKHGELSKKEAEALLRMMSDEEKTSGKPEDQTKGRRGYYPEVEKTW